MQVLTFTGILLKGPNAQNHSYTRRKTPRLIDASREVVTALHGSWSPSNQVLQLEVEVKLHTGQYFGD